MRRPIESRWFRRQGPRLSPFVRQDTWTHPLLPPSSWVSITRTWSRTLKGGISRQRLIPGLVPMRCPYMCTFFEKAKTSSSNRLALNDLLAPGPSRPSSQVQNPPIPWGLDALGRRMSDFGIFGTQQEFKGCPELWSPRVSLMCT